VAISTPEYERRLLPRAVLLALLAAAPYLTGAPAGISQQLIDAAVARALAEQQLPSPAARVYEAVKGAIVRVRAIDDALEDDKYLERAVGSGVVIVDRGLILTNLRDCRFRPGAGGVRRRARGRKQRSSAASGERPRRAAGRDHSDDLTAAVVRPRPTCGQATRSLPSASRSASGLR
jgi:hypothetical protein